MKQTLAIVKKELNSYFSSPMALIFVGVFLAATLFTFFWMETFFARGIADVRPMFNWMPILLIFLVAALTMRQWSEEQQSGTLEILLTLPANTLQLVLGKFMAVMVLIGVALLLTLPIPLTVSWLGNLDWGPVFGGYLAALLLASAYATIGLFVSSRTDNQIVALILTVLVGGILYLIGARPVADFFGNTTAEILRSFASGSRFESIQRGVIDIRDLAYYISLTVFFLALNVVSLDSKRWSQGIETLAYRRNAFMAVLLIGLNMFALNVWLFPLAGLRVDITAQREHSLSQTTYDILGTLQEPLLVRAYFSEKTHPLLAPLMPQVRDMLTEYEIASNGNMQIEIIDPLQDPEKEAEANQTYGIQPTPLQAADRYGASVVNAYFDILVRYGDQSTVLNFRDLIEVTPSRTGQVEVTLRNLEYDLTSAIKKSVFGFQSIDSILAKIDGSVTLTLFYTPQSLPEWMAEVPTTIEQVANDIATESGGKFSFEMTDVDDPNSGVNRQTMAQQYGMQAIPVGLFSDQSYYLHMVLQIGDQGQLLFPSGELTEADIRTAIEQALKRSSDGFLKVIGVWTPPDTPQQNAFGQMAPSFKRYTRVVEQLRQDYTVQTVNLSTGQVPLNVDVLLVIAPQTMSDLERYAIDQYLMRGGSLILSAGNFILSPDQMTGSLGVAPITNGVDEMLAHYGFEIEPELVLDPQNEPFPMQVPRNVGGMQIVEIQAINYPFFVDIRSDGMDKENPAMANIPAVTLNWASPIVVDEAKNEAREVSLLLQSTNQAWTQTDSNIIPEFELYPELGFAVGEEQQSQLLAVSAQGRFESFFKDKEIPQPEADPNQPLPAEPVNTIGTIEESPENTRLVVIGSAEFLNDTVFELSANLTGDRYVNSLSFIQNTVDWSVEDLDLLTIRSRGTGTRVLSPEAEASQSLWEGINYGLAFAGLAIIAIIWWALQRSEQPMELIPPREEDNPVMMKEKNRPSAV